MPEPTRGTIRASKGYAIFRIIFGLLFIGLGIERHSATGATSHAGWFTIGIGLLFLVYGVVALLSNKALRTQVDLDPPRRLDPTERLAELLKLKNDGLITEAEFEAKRQEILRGI